MRKVKPLRERVSLSGFDVVWHLSVRAVGAGAQNSTKGGLGPLSRLNRNLVDKTCPFAKSQGWVVLSLAGPGGNL